MKLKKRYKKLCEEIIDLINEVERTRGTRYEQQPQHIVDMLKEFLMNDKERKNYE